MSVLCPSLIQMDKYSSSCVTRIKTKSTERNKVSFDSHSSLSLLLPIDHHAGHHVNHRRSNGRTLTKQNEKRLTSLILQVPKTR